jgi:hypothetical protein
MFAGGCALTTGQADALHEQTSVIITERGLNSACGWPATEGQAYLQARRRLQISKRCKRMILSEVQTYLLQALGVSWAALRL